MHFCQLVLREPGGTSAFHTPVLLLPLMTPCTTTVLRALLPDAQFNLPRDAFKGTEDEYPTLVPDQE